MGHRHTGSSWLNIIVKRYRNYAFALNSLSARFHSHFALLIMRTWSFHFAAQKLSTELSSEALLVLLLQWHQNITWATPTACFDSSMSNLFKVIHSYLCISRIKRLGYSASMLSFPLEGFLSEALGSMPVIAQLSLWHLHFSPTTWLLKELCATGGHVAWFNSLNLSFL